MGSLFKPKMPPLPPVQPLPEPPAAEVSFEDKEALPEAGDIEGQGQYWKAHYNTPLGKGTVTKYVYEVQKILKEA